MVRGPAERPPLRPTWWATRDLPDHVRLFLPPIGALGIPELVSTGMVGTYPIFSTHRYQSSLATIFEEAVSPAQVVKAPAVPDNTMWHVLAAHTFHNDGVANKTLSVAIESPDPLLLSVNVTDTINVGVLRTVTLMRPIRLGPGMRLTAVTQQPLPALAKISLAAIYVASALGEHVEL